MKNENTLLIVIGVIIAVFLIGGLGYGMMNYNYGYRMMGGYYGYGMGVFGWIFMILVAIVLVLLIVWLIKQIKKK